MRSLVLALSVTTLPLLGACGGGGGGGGGGIDLQSSTVAASVDFGTEADGSTPVTITVTLLDGKGNPVSGQDVVLSLGEIGATITQPTAPTDALGVATGTVVAAIAGPKTVTATVDPAGKNDVLAQQATTTFIQIPARARYVRASGSDGNGGSSPLDAWATPGFALTQLQPGDTLFVGAGTYAGALDVTTSGTTALPIELRGDRDGTFTGDAGRIVVDAAGGDYAVRLNGVSDVVVRGLTLTGALPLADGGGLYIAGGSDLHVVDNEVYGNECGIWVDAAQRVRVESNRISNNVGTNGDGMRLEQTSDVVLENNLIYNNARYGLFLADAAVSTSVTSNTFYSNLSDQIHEEGSGSSGTIRDSLVSEGLATGISLVDSSGINEVFNLVWGNAGPDVQVGSNPPGPPSGSADPEFVLPAGLDGILGGANGTDDDFRLALGSPGFDTGSTDAKLARLPFGGSLRGMSSRVDGVQDGAGTDGALLNLGMHVASPVDDFDPLDVDHGRLLFAGGDDVRLQGSARTGSGWQAGDRGLALNEGVRWIVHRSSSRASAEEFFAALCDDGNQTEFFLGHFDGSRWSEAHPLTRPVSNISSANAGQRGFDLECEASSGEALFVFSNDDDIPLYRSFSNGGWSQDQPVFSAPPTGGTILWVELVARPGSDEIALVVLDDLENLLALVWDGSAWTDSGVPTVLGTQIAELRDSQAFDAAYESLSGDLLVGWGFNTVQEETRFAERDATSGNWTISQHVSTDAVGAVYRLAADPTSDFIVAGIGEGLVGADVAGMMWDGSQWADVAGELVQPGPTDQVDLAVGWVGTTGRAVVILDRDNTGGVLQWARWKGQIPGWNNMPDVPISGFGDLAFANLRSAPGSDELVGLLVDEMGDMYSLRATLQTEVVWSLEGGGPIASELTPVGAGEPFDFSFRP